MSAEFHRMKALYDEMLLSILHSATNETGCLAITEQPPIMPVSSLLGGDTRVPLCRSRSRRALLSLRVG